MKWLILKYKGISHGGGRGISINGQVTEGPSTTVGRDCQTILTFDQVESIYKFYLECKERVEKNEKEVQEINERSQAD